MNEKDDDIAHPGRVSKPERTRDFGPIQEFAMHRPIRQNLILLNLAVLQTNRQLLSARAVHLNFYLAEVLVPGNG